MHPMRPIFRPYQNEEDYWRMREFLRRVFMVNNRLERSWHVARLDYARWHLCLNCDRVRLEDVVYLWETGCEGDRDRAIVAILMPEGGPGEAHIMIHPDFDTVGLEQEMLSIAEERLAVSDPDGSRRLCVWAPEQNALRQSVLSARDYERRNAAEYQWRRDLPQPIPDAPMAPGYTIRSLGDGLELLERCYASGLGFHEGDINTAVENRDDPTWYLNIQNAPLYRRDLDLVAIAPDGAVAAFCTIWFDDVTRSAYIEPLATVPAHRRRGLGRALLTEGLRRLQRMGATRAFVGGFSPAANALYESVVGPQHELYEPWVKKW